MKSSDYFDVFRKSLRSNPKLGEKIKLPIEEISHRAALGESWAKIAKDHGVSPRTITLRVREYRLANLGSDSVLRDITLERDSGKNWLELASRAGWPDSRDTGESFAQEFNRLMLAKAKVKKKRGGGRPKKVLSEASYRDFCAGRKTLDQIAEENSMTPITAKRRLLELAGPDVQDINVLVDKTPALDKEQAKELIEEVIADVQTADEPEVPEGFFYRDEILIFVKDGIPVPEVAEAYGLSIEDVEKLVALENSPKSLEIVETAVSDASSAIEEAIVEAVPESVEEAPRPVKAVKKKRGRKKKVFEFSDAEREFIRQAYYDNDFTVSYITDELSRRRGEKLTQVAIKGVISDYSQGRGRRSKLDKVALEKDARRNLAVSTLAEMYDVSAPTITKALREMGIKPIYSLAKEAMLRKPSEEEKAARQAILAKVQSELDAILDDDARREALKSQYLASNLITQNDVAVLADRYGLSTYNMARVLSEIFSEEIRRIRERDRLEDLMSQYGQVQVNKIKRDLIDRTTLTLRSNPERKSKVVPTAIGVAGGLAVDQTFRYLYPEMSSNKRNIVSGGVVAAAGTAEYMYRKDESAIWRAAGGITGVLLSRFIEEKFQK